ADSRARSNNAAPLTTAPSIRLLAGLNQAPSNHDVTGSHKPDFQPCTHVPPGTPTTFGSGALRPPGPQPGPGLPGHHRKERGVKVTVQVVLHADDDANTPSVVREATGLVKPSP